MSIPTILYYIQVSYELNSGSWANRKCGDMKRTKANSNFGVGALNEHMNTIVHSYVLGRCVMLDGSIKYLRPGLVPNSLLSTMSHDIQQALTSVLIQFDVVKDKGNF